MTNTNQAQQSSGSTEHYDAVIVGAGVSGMYALHHLREMGLSVRAYDGATDCMSSDHFGQKSVLSKRRFSVSA